MKSSYSSPGEFLAYLRSISPRPMSGIQSRPNPEFQAILDSKLGAAPFDSVRPTVDRTSAHNHIAEELWRSLLTCLPEKIAAELNPLIAVGALDDIDVNAVCARSDEGFIAILINAGLMTLFNKLSKIHAAVARPDSILYCNRTGSEAVSAETLRAWTVEVCEHYVQTGKPLGPQIHLNGPAELLHATQLHLWEMFILSHELGHVLCGHMNEENFLRINPCFGMVATLEEKSSHEMETEADIAGFLLLRRVARARLFESGNEQADDRPFLLPIITLFDLLFMLGARGSTSHPHPLDRLCNIVAFVYGTESAARLAQSYEDHKILPEFFKHPIFPRSEALAFAIGNAYRK